MSSDSHSYTDDLIAHLTQNGFIWGPEPELYNGLAGFYTYGPMGTLLKNKVEDVIRDTFKEYQFYEIEAPIIMPEMVWEASGHLETFVDPIILTKDTGRSFRADKLIEEQTDIDVADGMTDKEMLNTIGKYEVTAPDGERLEGEITDYNLMMKTKVGGQDAFLRPETATTTYLPVNRFWQFFRKKLPFSVFQIGKAFRNEISPRKHVLRGREFTQAEGQLFVHPDQKNNWDRYSMVEEHELPLWSATMQEDGNDPTTMTVDKARDQGILQTDAYAWCMAVAYDLFTSMGIPEERIRIREHSDDEKAHYAAEAWDIEIKLDSYGWTEACGVHDRTDYDLRRHEEFSNNEIKIRDEDGNKVIPDILEIAFGTDRPVFGLLDISYDQENGQLHIPKHIAPLDAAIFPLVSKENLPSIAREIFRQLHEQRFDVEYDDSGSIGKRYARNDAKGTATCITVDFDTKEDSTVTIRDRNSGDQVRVKMGELGTKLEQWLYTDIAFDELGQDV